MNYSNQLSFLRLNITVGNEAQQEKLSMNNYESATEFSYKNVSNSKAQISPSKKAVMLEGNIAEFATGKKTLENHISF